MGSLATALIVIIGLPLILIGGGFFLLALRAFRGGEARAEKSQTLELARQLERALSAMETRLTALEDLILASEDKFSAQNNTGEAGK